MNMNMKIIPRYTNMLQHDICMLAYDWTPVIRELRCILQESMSCQNTHVSNLNNLAELFDFSNRVES